jgi:MbtH protein
MTDEAREDDTIYTVVVNDEGQYSLWFAGRPLPPGWKEVGKRGTKTECLDEVTRLWTDMRPKSIRDRPS